MARTRQEVRDFLNSQVGQKVNAKAGIYNGQCVSLIKALLEFLGAPNPYAGRGNAITVNDALLREGLAANGKGWLTIVVNRDMGRIFENGVWNNYGHIWIDLQNEANYEQNGARALYTTKNTRPITQGQQFVNLDKYIGENDMPRVAIPPNIVREHYINYTGHDPGENSPATQNRFEDTVDDEFWYGLASHINNVRKNQAVTINNLNNVVAELSSRPTREMLDEQAKVITNQAQLIEKLGAENNKLLKEQNSDKEAGESFLRRLGQFISKYWTIQ